jgi:hypothetical protein
VEFNPVSPLTRCYIWVIPSEMGQFWTDRLKNQFFGPKQVSYPHLVHQGQFWPSKAIFGSKFAILSFGAFLAPKISNKRAAYFFLIPLAFLHLIWRKKYIFDVGGWKLAKNSKNRAKMAKIGYTQMAILCKNISSDLLQNGPKYISRTNLHFDIDFREELH